MRLGAQEAPALLALLLDELLRVEGRDGSRLTVEARAVEGLDELVRVELAVEEGGEVLLEEDAGGAPLDRLGVEEGVLEVGLRFPERGGGFGHGLEGFMVAGSGEAH